ncbi:ATP synthase subunit C lysine N-methyltransferase-like [Rhinophrynus dorsalis]
MEDNIEIILLNKTTKFTYNDKPNHRLPWLVAAVTSSVYGLWAVFVLPGFRKVPFKLKVPFLPSGKSQTANVIKLLDGRQGTLVDLGSGDGRLVFAAVSLGFQCTGYELNPILVTWAKTQAAWKRISPSQATFVKQDFWAIDLSRFNNVTVFLAPSVVTDGVRLRVHVKMSLIKMETLQKKLSEELPNDARVIACRFPFPHWPPTCSVGTGLDQVWAYDMMLFKKHLLQLRKEKPC